MVLRLLLIITRMAQKACLLPGHSLWEWRGEPWGEVGLGGSAGAEWCLEVTTGTGGPYGLACSGPEPRPGEQLIPLPALAFLPGPSQLLLGCCFWVVSARGTEKGECVHGSP